MDLHLLQKTTNVSIYDDADNDWLFIDWRGELTLPLVQESCLVIAECFLARPYSRILNSNQNVTDFTLNVPVWLHQEYIPLLSHTGIEYLAWVYAPNMLLKPFIDKLVSKIEVPVVNLFDDVESAASWLQHTRFHYRHDIAQQRAETQRNALEHLVEALRASLGREPGYVQSHLVEVGRQHA
jgi:hypothetical protein